MHDIGARNQTEKKNKTYLRILRENASLRTGHTIDERMSLNSRRENWILDAFSHRSELSLRVFENVGLTSVWAERKNRE